MKPGRFGFCLYCRRNLTPAHEQVGTSFTLDHVKAEADGGYRRAPCCKKCNGLKGRIGVDHWFWFIGHHQRWWKTFHTSRQVEVVIQAEVIRRVRDGEPKISRLHR